MKVLILVLVSIASAHAAPQDAALNDTARTNIEKAVLEVNAQMTRAAEEQDIDRLFSYMLPTARGSIIVGGRLFETREAALSYVKGNARGGATVKYHWKHLLVTVISPTTALLVSDGESEIRPAQDPSNAIVSPFSQTVLFVLTDGKWKALHAHQSAVPR